MSTNTGVAPVYQHGVRGRDEAERGHQDLIPLGHADRLQRQVQPGGAGVHGDRVGDPVHVCERPLEAAGPWLPIVIQPLSMTSLRASFSSRPRHGSATGIIAISLSICAPCTLSPH